MVIPLTWRVQMMVTFTSMEIQNIPTWKEARKRWVASPSPNLFRCMHVGTDHKQINGVLPAHSRQGWTARKGCGRLMRTKGSETSCSSMGSAAGVQFLPKLVNSFIMWSWRFSCFPFACLLLCDHRLDLIGLPRNGKGWRLRWIIYLRSGLKRGNCSPKRRKLLGMKEIKHNSN